MLKMTCMKVTEETKRGERDYVTPSCKMMMIEESSLLAGTGTQNPGPLLPPNPKDPDATDPNTAKEGNASVWEE